MNISVSNNRGLFDDGYKNEFANGQKKNVVHSQSTKDLSSYNSKDTDFKPERHQHQESKKFEPYVPGQKNHQRAANPQKKSEENRGHNVQFGQTKPRTQHRNEFYDNSNSTHQNEPYGKIHKSQSGPSLFRLGQKTQVQPPPPPPRKEAEPRRQEINENHDKPYIATQSSERPDDHQKRYQRRDYDKEYQHDYYEKESPRSPRDNTYRPSQRGQDDRQGQRGRDGDQKSKSNRSKPSRQQPHYMAGGVFN